MANENFGLSFTVEHLAIWADTLEGAQSPANQFVFVVKTDAQSPANQFSPVISAENQSPANQFVFFVATDMQSPATQVDILGLCAVASILSGPEQSNLSGAGLNILSCL